MRSRIRLISCLAIMVMILGACSSTTVVARNERPASPDSSESAAATDDSSSSDSNDSDSTSESASIVDDADADSSADDDRGSREGTEPRTPRELEEEQGFGLGGAEQLGGLLDDCELGNNMACDILFELSAFDSIEETTALSCGGRSETTSIFCTEGITSTGDELVFDEDSSGLDAVVTACEDDADMTACDFLYFRSPFESTYEEIGATCGGRVQVAVPDCRTFIGDS